MVSQIEFDLAVPTSMYNVGFKYNISRRRTINESSRDRESRESVSDKKSIYSDLRGYGLIVLLAAITNIFVWIYFRIDLFYMDFVSESLREMLGCHFSKSSGTIPLSTVVLSFQHSGIKNHHRDIEASVLQ
ncbi:hypothetical protein IEQ34_011380 [Dendrobium chrysotoxum]|uniref:Uncharacterized protein n=1 Tax=Dendrobium chrysotoxum TaxID=161865 RepID=A0AAV7GXL6_DENCH|nr:hypothetical protein IEQ34_011380 [Dendrobium chrysotoxum]